MKPISTRCGYRPRRRRVDKKARGAGNAQKLLHNEAIGGGAACGPIATPMPDTPRHEFSDPHPFPTTPNRRSTDSAASGCAGSSPKILSKAQLLAARGRLRTDGLTIVQCHGCFDIVHPGHIRHLRQAKSAGDTLLVSITGDAEM